MSKKSSALVLFVGVVCLALTGPPVTVGQQKSKQRGVSSVKSKASPQMRARYFALIVGINHYKYYPALSTPLDDAREIGSTLHSQYGFQTELLLDASHDQILAALAKYRNTLKDNDNLLIYYAGHGYYDKAADLAYWFPVDAEKSNPAHWINATEITGQARAIAARHVLIVSDSCYSGMIARGAVPTVGTAPDRKIYLETLVSGKSRYVIASGGNEPVADNDPGRATKHSVFANALLRGLNQFAASAFSAEELFYQYVRQPVIGGSHQSPEYDIIRDSGHDSGGFVFFRSGTVPDVKPTPPVVPAVAKDTPAPPDNIPSHDPVAGRGERPRNSDAQAVFAAAQAYTTAYQTMDIEVLKAAWPSLSKAQTNELKNGFQGAQAVKVELQRCDTSPVFSGEIAQLNCDQSMVYTRDGKRQSPEVHAVQIRFRKAVNGTWVVDDVRSR